MTAARSVTSSDDELLAAVAKGDCDAFSELYDRFAPLVFGRAQSRFADRRLAADITREAFLDFWRRAPRLDRGAGSVALWLFTTEHRGPTAAALAGESGS